MNKTRVRTKQTILLLGYPNTGKTTLFNALTGSKQKIANYPGSTVDFHYASRPKQTKQIIIDTPGLHSFNPQSEDEKLSLKCLTQLNSLIPNTHKQPDLVLVVVDATQCHRQLSLIKQLKQQNIPIVIALSMIDEAEKQDITIDTDTLSNELCSPVIPIHAKKQWQLEKLILTCNFQLMIHKHRIQKPIEDTKTDPKIYYQWSEKTAERIYKRTPIIPKITQILDHIFLHPLLGMALFLGIMTFFFCSLFLFTAPLITGIDTLFSWVSETLTTHLPQHWITRCLIEGGLGGIAGILVFVPQIACLFFGLSLLESSGYLARAAIIIDKPLSYLGFSGKSFVPLLSGCACAIPALLATRTIPNAKERFLCQWVIPLMQCSARLPVYGLLLGLLLPNRPLLSGFFLASIYLGSVVLASIITSCLSRYVKSTTTEPIFCMELPKWRRPHIKNTLIEVFNKTKSFIINAGPLIIGISFVLWAISTYPNEEHSIAVWLGHWIEPFCQPLGLDWRCGVAILLSFAAREVFVSVLAVMFATQEGTTSLFNSLSTAINHQTGEPLFTVSSILSLLVFFMIALQCGPTIAVAKKEMKSTYLPIIQMIFYLVLAYSLAYAVQLFT